MAPSNTSSSNKRSGAGGRGGNNNLDTASGSLSAMASLLLQLQQQQLGGDPNGSLTSTSTMFNDNNNTSTSSEKEEDDLRGFVLSADVTVAASQHPLAQAAMEQSMQYCISQQQQQQQEAENNTANSAVQDQTSITNNRPSSGGQQNNNNTRSSTPSRRNNNIDQQQTAQNNNNNNDQASNNNNNNKPLFIPDASSISVEFYIPSSTAFEALGSSINAASGLRGGNDGAAGILESSLSKAQLQQALAQQANPVTALPTSGTNSTTDPAIAQAINVNPSCLPPASAASYSNASNNNSSSSCSYDAKKEWSCIGRCDLMTQFTYMTLDQQQETLSNLQQQMQDQHKTGGGGGGKGSANKTSSSKHSSSHQTGNNADDGENNNHATPFLPPVLPTALGVIVPSSTTTTNNSTTAVVTDLQKQKQQTQQSGILYQQKKVLIPAPNFVRDFLCNEFVAVLIITSPTDKESAVQQAVLNCGQQHHQELPIVEQLRRHLQQLENQSSSGNSNASGAAAENNTNKGSSSKHRSASSGKNTSTSGKGSGNATASTSKQSNSKKINNEDVNNNNQGDDNSNKLPYEVKTYSFVVNLGSGLFNKKAELLSVVNPHQSSNSGAHHHHQYHLEGTFGGGNKSSKKNNNDSSSFVSAPKQFEVIPGIESFSVKLESFGGVNGGLLCGRNKRRFPVAFFDIHSINDIPPPSMSLPPALANNNNHSSSRGNNNNNNMNTNTSNAAISALSNSLDLRLNTLSPAAATTASSHLQQQPLESTRVHQQLAASQVAPPRVAFMWNNQLIFTPRAKFSTDPRNNSSRWLFQYSRPLYCPCGTNAAEGRSGAGFALLKQLWYNTMDFAVFDNEQNSLYGNNNNNNNNNKRGTGKNNNDNNSNSSSSPHDIFLSNLLQPLPCAPPSAFAKLSLRDLVELGITSVEETVPVLPERPQVVVSASSKSDNNGSSSSSSSSLLGPQKVRVPHYVAFGTTLKCRVRLSAPLPFPVYVPPVPRKNLLTSNNDTRPGTTSTAATNTNANNNNIFSSEHQNKNDTATTTASSSLVIDSLEPSKVKEVIAPFENPSAPKNKQDKQHNQEEDDDSSKTAAAASSSFLTRIVLTLPYRSEMTKNVLRAVYSYLIQAAEKGNKTSDLFELPMLNEDGTDFAGDHFVDSVKLSSLLDQQQQQQGNTHHGKNAGNKKNSNNNATTAGGGKSSSAGANNNNNNAASSSQLTSARSPSQKEKEAIGTARAFEDSELAFHPFGNTMRRRLFISVPDEVSGLELIDGDIRLVVIEAPCPIIAKVADLATEVAGPDLHNMRMLFNYELPFMRRDYHVWPPLVRPLQQTSQQALLKQQQQQLLQQQQQAQNSARRQSSSVERQATPTKSSGNKRRTSSGNQQSSSKNAKKSTSSSNNKSSSSRHNNNKDDQNNNQQQQEDSQQNNNINNNSQQQLKLSSIFGGADASAALLTMEALPDLDPGALGGRIRRVRLSCSLKSILQDPSQFLKRSLPSDALEAAVKLSSLAGIQLEQQQQGMAGGKKPSSSSSPTQFLATTVPEQQKSFAVKKPNGVINPPETMLEALQRDMFPSQASIVSLERATGDCLSTEDVCCDGDKWIPFTKDFDYDGFADDLAKKRIESATEQLRDQHLLTEHTKNLGQSRLPRVGTVLSFIGIPAMAKDLGLSDFGKQQQDSNNNSAGAQRKFPPISLVAQQYPKSRKSYVKVLQASFLIGNKVRTDANGDPMENATTVSTSGGTASGDKAICWPCVFPSGIVLSNQPIRFEITGQVVPSRNSSKNNNASSMNLLDPQMCDSILFVLDCKAYSAQGSDCRNPDFDKKKIQDKRIVPPKEFKKVMSKREKQQKELDALYLEKKKQHQQQKRSSSISGLNNSSINNNNLGSSTSGVGVIKNEAISIRASYEKNRKRRQIGLANNDLGNNNDDDISSSDGEDDSPPRDGTTLDSGRSKNFLPIPQKDWHSLAIDEMRNKSKKNADHKDSDTMTQAAKYQRAAELYQKQEDQRLARERVIENLRSSQTDRPAFRSHQLRTANQDNRHPKSLDEPLASRDQTPLPLTMRPNLGGGGSSSNNENNNAAASRLLPPMKFLNASKAFDSNAVYSFNKDETEDDREEQQRERIRKQQEDFKKNMLVSDPVFHVTTRKPRDHPLQMDAIGSILIGEPKKKSIKQSFAPPPPISLREGFIEEKKERVDPKKSKHPEQRQFVYPKNNLTEPLPKKASAVSESEKIGAVWGK